MTDYPRIYKKKSLIWQLFSIFLFFFSFLSKMKFFFQKFMGISDNMFPFPFFFDKKNHQKKSVC